MANKEYSLFLTVRKLFVLLIIISVFSTKGQYRFRHIKVTDGLSQSSVNFVIRDKSGYYWIGTQYGLNCFNGKTITCYYSTNTPGIPDNFFISAIEDKHGNLWFATRTNLCRYSIKKQKFSTVACDTIEGAKKGYNPVWNLILYNNSVVFSSRGSIYEIDETELNHDAPKFTKIANANYVFVQNEQLAFLKRDSILFLDKQKNSHKLIKRFSQHQVDFKNPPIICRLSSANYIINNNLIYKINNDSLILLFTGGPEAINTILDINGGYILGTNNGLIQLNQNWKIERTYKNDKNDEFSLSENKILSISKTDDGLYWIGTANSGVNIHDKKTEVFKYITRPVSQNYLCFCCSKINDTTMCIGTEDGIDYFHMNNNRWNYKETRLKGVKVTALIQRKNTLYAGTTEGLFSIYNNITKKIILENSPLETFHLSLDKDGLLLVSTNQGLYVLSPENEKTIFHINRQSRNENGDIICKTNYYFSTTVDNYNNYYINSTVGTVKANSSFTQTKNLFENFNYKNLSEIMIVKSIIKHDGSMYFGSLGNGVYIKKDDKTFFINETNGLSNNVVASMEKDKKERIWVSTNSGINYISETRKVNSFTNELNISSTEFITNASCSLNNDLVFCTNNGVLSFNPDSVLNIHPTGLLKLKPVSFIKNYIDTLSSDSLITLLYNDYSLSFHFCVPSYNNFHKVRLSYKLENTDTLWHSFENNKPFTFIKLPFGNYKLTVKASVEEIGWSEEKNYTINVIPPFWKTTWFMVLCVVLIITIAGSLTYYFSRIKLKRRLQALLSEQKLLEERHRISQDLHDNIGTQISTIISGLDRINLTKKADNTDKLSEFARNTLGQLRETVWALNQKEISLSDFKSKLEDYLFELRTNYEEITIELNFKFTLNRVLDPAIVLDIFRIIQEGISNSIKHSGCSSILLKITSDDSTLSIVISDNGKGFNVDDRKKGHYGLDNMLIRAKKHDLSYSISSTPTLGTEISLTLRL